MRVGEWMCFAGVKEKDREIHSTEGNPFLVYNYFNVVSCLTVTRTVQESAQ